MEIEVYAYLASHYRFRPKGLAGIPGACVVRVVQGSRDNNTTKRTILLHVNCPTTTNRSPLNNHPHAVELKAASFTLPIIRLCNCNLDEIAHELNNHIAKGLRFFKNAPVVIDLEPLNDQICPLDFIALAELLKSLNMVSVGLRNANSQQKKEASAAGLASLEGGVIQNLSACLESKKAMEPQSIQKKQPPHIVHQTVRSGQQIHTQGRDVIVLAPVNAGAEIVAEHNIHVYGSLRGRAFAGTQGDKTSRIFVQSMEAELVSIAGHYQVFDDPTLSAIHGMPAHFFLQDDQLTFTALK